jgi:hypothetical protein
VADDVPDPVADLIRSFVQNLEDPAGGLGDWAFTAFVLEFPDGRFNSAHGYLYAADGRISPVAADPWAVGTAVDAYLDSHTSPRTLDRGRSWCSSTGRRAATRFSSRTPMRTDGTRLPAPSGSSGRSCDRGCRESQSRPRPGKGRPMTDVHPATEGQTGDPVAEEGRA